MIVATVHFFEISSQSDLSVGFRGTVVMTSQYDVGGPSLRSRDSGRVACNTPLIRLCDQH